MNVLENDNIIVTVPSYLSDPDSLEGSDISVSESEVPEESDDPEEVEQGGSDQFDYSSEFDDLSTLLTSIDSTSDEILINIDNLNNNLIIFHNDVKILIGFGFCLMIYLVIKMVSTIFNKVLGFGNC